MQFLIAITLLSISLAALGFLALEVTGVFLAYRYYRQTQESQKQFLSYQATTTLPSSSSESDSESSDPYTDPDWWKYK